MICYLIDQTPRFCPECGMKYEWNRGEDIIDFEHGLSQYCNGCGSRFQFMPRNALLRASTQHGDLTTHLNV